jgi:hypothetical protein
MAPGEADKMSLPRGSICGHGRSTSPPGIADDRAAGARPTNRLRGPARTNQGGGTEDEAFVLLAAELPVFLGPIRLVVDAEGLSGTMQVQIVASRFVATGFGRAPAAICRVSGTGLVAPAL